MREPSDEGEEILFRRAGDHVAIVTLNRPRVRNAVNGVMARALEAVVEAVEADPEIRVAVLTSSNDKVFCAGADLSELSRGEAPMNTERGGFAGFVDFPRRKPWIAAVRGSALGGGCELALACDLIIAGDTSVFGLPEVKRSLLAGAGGMFRLPRVLPRNIALEMIATGEPISAHHLAGFGFVNRVAADSDVIETAVALAESIAKNAPIAVYESLGIARRFIDLTDAELRQLTNEAYGRLATTEDFKEGPRAFLERRAPRWSGR